jgi:predicted DCC family thiol-disulfide oxidoreductase YuxK
MILFFDGSCSLCYQALLFIFKRDKTEQFYYAPLDGVTAIKELGAWRQMHPHVDSIVLIEKGQVLFYTKALLRIFWHLEGFWRVLGVFSFLPSWMLYPLDLLYRMVAYFRKRNCSLQERERFCKLLENKLLN